MKKVYLIPNFVTTANMFCGFYSIIASIQSDYWVAAWAILLAGVFDMLDGRIARLAKATSAFGEEYDSMSDLLSFGLAPALLLYQWALSSYGRLGWMVAFLYVAGSALRLARFNVNTDVINKKYFQGLPTPVSAGWVSTFVIFCHGFYFQSEIETNTLALGMTLLLSFLMISNVPFPSFKEVNWRSRVPRSLLLLIFILFFVIAVKPEVTLFLLNSLYILISLCFAIYQLKTGKKFKEVFGYSDEE